jgi:hypothetical protein
MCAHNPNSRLITKNKLEINKVKLKSNAKIRDEKSQNERLIREGPEPGQTRPQALTGQ